MVAANVIYELLVHAHLIYYIFFLCEVVLQSVLVENFLLIVRNVIGEHQTAIFYFLVLNIWMEILLCSRICHSIKNTP